VEAADSTGAEEKGFMAEAKAAVGTSLVGVEAAFMAAEAFVGAPAE